MQNKRTNLPSSAGVRLLLGDRRVLVLGVSISAAVLILIGTFIIARPRYIETKAKIASGLAEIEKARTSWSLANAEPLAAADPAAMEEHARRLQVLGEGIERESIRLRDGEGMFFWFFWCRGREVAAFQNSLHRERGIAAAAKEALAAVQPLRLEAAGWLSDSMAARGQADARLIPTSDEGDFAQLANELKAKLADLSGRRSGIARARTAPSLTGLPERYRLAVLTYLEQRLEGEMDRVKERMAAALQAARLLREYKAAMSDTLEGSGNVILALESLSTNVLPLAEAAFQATHPVHEAIGFLKQPIPSGNPVGNLMDNVLPSVLKAEITPFGILSQLNPELGDQIETVETVCEVIQVFHRETSSVAAAMVPFAGSLREFETVRSRDSMYQVLDSLPGAVDSLNSLAARAEDALGELARVRTVAGELRQVGQLARQIYIRNLVDATASAADSLVEQASQPFVELKERLQGTAAGLLSLKDQEERYQRELAALQSGDGVQGKIEDEVENEASRNDDPAMAEIREIPECGSGDRPLEVIPATRASLADLPDKVREAAEQAGRYHEGSGTLEARVEILEVRQLNVGVEGELKPVYALTLRVTGGGLGENGAAIQKGLYSAWSETTFPYLRDGEVSAKPTGEYKDGTPTLFPFWWSDEWEKASFAMEAKPYFVDEEGFRRHLYVFPGEVGDGSAVELVQGYADIYVPSCRFSGVKVKIVTK
jgi:hypothetical protein